MAGLRTGGTAFAVGLGSPDDVVSVPLKNLVQSEPEGSAAARTRA
jgi:hypothetical protein